MPAKRRKFESTFPAARIKKIMQLDDDVGRVASSVPIVISRAVELFLEGLLSKANTYASSRNAKTLTVGHIKHCIENEKQWDFLRDLTANVPDINACNESEGSPKRGRKRKNSSSKVEVTLKRKTKKVDKSEETSSKSTTESGQEDDPEDSDSDSSSHSSSYLPHPVKAPPIDPSPLAILQKRLGDSNPNPTNQPCPSILPTVGTSSPLMALASTLSTTKQAPPILSSQQPDDDDDDEYD